MGVSYDTFGEYFRDKVTDYDFPFKDESLVQDMVDGYMKRACSQFNKSCKYDLSDRDDETRTFAMEPTTAELDEIADIVSEGMIVQWLKPFAYKSELLENLLNTSDFTSYSPANLLEKVQAAHQNAMDIFRNMRLAYTYDHADLTKWWS